jgi:HSP20 family protein
VKSWDPFRDLLTIQDRLNKLFESVLSGPAVPGHNIDEIGVWRPVAEVVDGPGTLELVCELPGLDRDQVHVSLDGSVLTVEGERVRPAEAESWVFHRIERPFGKFLRRFELPDGIDAEHVDASMRDGLLRVTLPKPAGEP